MHSRTVCVSLNHIASVDIELYGCEDKFQLENGFVAVASFLFNSAPRAKNDRAQLVVKSTYDETWLAKKMSSTTFYIRSSTTI